jgi:hypothetical protein
MRRYESVCQGMRSTTSLGWPLCVGILCLATVAGVVQAGEVYKSIDADGKVIYSDHLDPSMSQTTTVQLEDPHSLPGQLHFCWTNCFTLVLDDGVYRRADGTDESWTVETFSTDAIVLHRHDPPVAWNGYSQDVVYAGHVSDDRLIDVTVNGKPISGIDASWGTALSTLPGTNAERDAMTSANLNASSGSTVTSVATPPSLPAEDQPPLSQDGYLWTPGYWYWRNQAYLWVPGAWMRPPQAGFLWTPAYWGFAGTAYVFHPGHWGSTVGFYGGINYGHGYFGNGYAGGHWSGNSFAYNSTVNHVDPAVAHHTYAESVPGQGSRGVLSYTGGQRSGDSARSVSQHPSPARVVNKPETRTTVERTSEAEPAPTKANRPAMIANTPAPSVPPKANHNTPTRAVPVKQ